MVRLMLSLEKIAFMEWRIIRDYEKLNKCMKKIINREVYNMENIRHKDARPMMDLIAKKIFSDSVR